MNYRHLYLAGAMAAVAALGIGFAITGAVAWLLVGFCTLLTAVLVAIVRSGNSE